MRLPEAEIPRRVVRGRATPGETALREGYEEAAACDALFVPTLPHTLQLGWGHFFFLWKRRRGEGGEGGRKGGDGPIGRLRDWLGHSAWNLSVLRVCLMLLLFADFNDAYS